MAKTSGTTRRGSASNPRGLANGGGISGLTDSQLINAFIPHYYGTLKDQIEPLTALRKRGYEIEQVQSMYKESSILSREYQEKEDKIWETAPSRDVAKARVEELEREYMAKKDKATEGIDELKARWRALAKWDVGRAWKNMKYPRMDLGSRVD